MKALRPGLVRLIGRIPQYVPDWPKPILRPFYNLIYRLMYSSIKEEKLVKTAKGPYIYVNYWDDVERECANGTYERRYVDFFCSVIREGDVVVDVGAYIGYFSLLASGRVGAKGRVYSFEPIPRNFERLKRNLEVNKTKNIRAYNLGLSDRDETLSFTVPREIPAQSSLAASWSELTKGAKLTKDTVKAKLTTFDRFGKDAGLNKVDIIKIDVDGAELKVLKGMRKTLTKSTDIWLFLEVAPPLVKLLDGSVVDLTKLLVKCGFKTAYLVDLDSEIDISKLSDHGIVTAFGDVARNYILPKGKSSNEYLRSKIS
jgi:FkbM family methyltransferase